MTTTRDTLKTYFSKGAIPKATEFAELIDRVLIQNDDKLFQTADGPLGIKAATGGRLLNFYDSRENLPTWQLKQKEGHADGLSLGNGKQSCLFIDSATGNIGVGTTETGNAKLTVAGDTRLNGKVDVTGETTLNGALTVKGATTNTKLEGSLTVDGLLTASKGANIAAGMMIVSADGKVGIGVDPTESLLHIKGSGGRTKGIHLSSTGKNDPAITVFPGTATPDAGLITFGDGTGWKFHIGKRSDDGATKFLTVQDNGNVGIGTTNPQAQLDVAGASRDGTGKIRSAGISVIGTETAFLSQLRVNGYITAGGQTRQIHKIVGNGTLHTTYAFQPELPAGTPFSFSPGFQVRNGEVVQMPWIEVTTFSNDWENHAGGFHPAAYFKDSLGIVHLKGLVKSGTFDWNGSAWQHSIAIFTLPDGFKPAQRELHVVGTFSGTTTTMIAAGRVDILPDGTVRPIMGNNAWLSLDGITFRAA